MRKVKWKNWTDDIDWAWIGQRHLSPTVGAVAMSVPLSEWYFLKAFQDFVRSNHNERVNIEHLYTAWITEDTEVSSSNELYSYGFPHTHNNGRTACAIVVQVPDEGGMTTVKVDGVVRFLPPIAGSGTIIESDESHGVLRVYGTIPRIAFVAQYMLQ